MPEGRRYVILGDGAAGITAAAALRRADPAGGITVLSDDPHPAYFRAALTNYLLGELRDDQIWAAPSSFYRDIRVDRLLGRAASLDTAAAKVRLTSGASLPYESLLIATGARARRAPFEGGELPGVATLRTLQDARAVMDLVTRGLGRAVVVGGGPLALEWAHALRERKVAVELLVRERHLMPGALDPIASDLVLARLRKGGISVRIGEEIDKALPGPNGSVTRVLTKSGQTLPCELVAVAIGVVCNTEFLSGSGVALGPRGGVKVDDRLRSSAPNVFAAGDVAEVQGRLLQLWEPARQAARVAAASMTRPNSGASSTGGETYSPGAHYFATRLYDLDFASIGDVSEEAPDTALVDYPRGTGRLAYRKLVVRNGRLRGALLIGEREAGVRKRGRIYKRLIDEGVDVTAIQGDLLDPAFDLLGYLETRAMVEKPPAAGPLAAPTSHLRGTQRIALFDKGPSVSLKPIVAERTVQAAPLLSIGFKIPVAPLPHSVDPGDSAYLEGMGRKFPLDRDVMNLGNHASADVVVADVHLSALHAQITKGEGGWFLRDLGSRAGTRVGGALITLPHKLRDGDRIGLGGVELLFCATKKNGEPSKPPAPASRAEASGLPQLEVRAGPGLGLRFALDGPQVTIGRDTANAVCLDDASVSRWHAVLTRIQGRYCISDLRSTRGTSKNGKRLVPDEDAPLEHGDRLELGEVVMAFLVP